MNLGGRLAWHICVIKGQGTMSLLCNSTAIVLLFTADLILLQSGSLLQQFCVDAWLCAEQKQFKFH